jgi:hypothetical protein
LRQGTLIVFRIGRSRLRNGDAGLHMVSLPGKANTKVTKKLFMTSCVFFVNFVFAFPAGS